MDIAALVITETWLTRNVSDQNIVGEVTPKFIPSCSSDSQEKVGGRLLLLDSLKYGYGYAIGKRVMHVHGGCF